jgi:hypothetical protein
MGRCRLQSDRCTNDDEQDEVNGVKKEQRRHPKQEAKNMFEHTHSMRKGRNSTDKMPNGRLKKLIVNKEEEKRRINMGAY